MNRTNLAILLGCQFISVSGTVLILTIGGLVGAALSPNPALATLPLSVMVLGTAGATVFAAMLMARVGRRIGFVVGALTAALGAFGAAWALVLESFVLFCVAVGLIGVNNAFVQQYRFAAAESVPVRDASKAISWVLLGAIGGAFFGPLLATQDAGWGFTPPYVRALVAVGAIQLVAATLFLGLGAGAVGSTGAQDAPSRPLRAIVVQPAYVVAVTAGVVGYGVMTLIMTATPLSMHIDYGFSLDDTALVIRWHVIAMYAPSLVSGFLIGRFGATRIIAVGVAAVVATLAFGLRGHEMLHYWWALVLLGVGWNFLYVGGTALLIDTYRPLERFKAQAVNEFSVFASSALASLLAGTVIHSFGWQVLLWSAAPPLLLMVAGLVWLKNRPVRDARGV